MVASHQIYLSVAAVGAVSARTRQWLHQYAAAEAAAAAAAEAAIATGGGCSIVLLRDRACHSTRSVVPANDTLPRSLTHRSKCKLERHSAESENLRQRYATFSVLFARWQHHSAEAFPIWQW